MRTLLPLTAAVLLLAGVSFSQDPVDKAPTLPPAQLTTVAIQTCEMKAMEAFYTQAFNASFQSVDTGGLKCRFGKTPGGLTVKLVPLRAKTDFKGYPTHQLGFRVGDVDLVVAAAKQHGGRLEGKVMRRATPQGTQVFASVRDPDGNTLELYSLEK